MLCEVVRDAIPRTPNAHRSSAYSVASNPNLGPPPVGIDERSYMLEFGDGSSLEVDDETVLGEVGDFGMLDCGTGYWGVGSVPVVPVLQNITGTG